jgi:hypothetical protein
MLFEMIVYIAVFTTIVIAAMAAVTNAQRFLHGGMAATHRRFILERGLREISRDIRNARRTLPAWGAWKAAPDTLVLEMPPGAPGAEAGGAVVWYFAEGTLNRGHAVRPGDAMPYVERLTAVGPSAVEFRPVDGAPGAVRVRVTRGTEAAAEMRLKRVWELVAFPRG